MLLLARQRIRVAAVPDIETNFCARLGIGRARPKFAEQLVPVPTAGVPATRGALLPWRVWLVDQSASPVSFWLHFPNFISALKEPKRIKMVSFMCAVVASHEEEKRGGLVGVAPRTSNREPWLWSLLHLTT